MYNNATEFLKAKGLIKDEFNEFIINGDFGKVSLNELLEEYADNKIQ